MYPSLFIMLLLLFQYKELYLKISAGEKHLKLCFIRDYNLIEQKTHVEFLTHFISVSGFFKAQDLMNYRWSPSFLSQICYSKVIIISSLGVYCYLLGNVSLLARQFWSLVKVYAEHQCKLSSVINQVADGYMIK